MKHRNVLLGAHISIAGGFDEAIVRAELIGCNTMQIFTKSNRIWNSKKITAEEAETFKEKLKKSNLSKILVHSAYIINLGSASKDTFKKSVKALKEEVKRCEELSIHYLILHPGSHGGGGEEAGIAQIAEGLNEVLDEKETTKILLETAAGSGSTLGKTFEQLREMYDKSHHKKRLGICMDTCHIFASGYDIRTEDKYHEVMHYFDKVIGLELLEAIHLNDSKKGLGSFLDRHEKIGQGALGLKAFELLVNDKKLDGIPMILETPIKKSYEEYGEELEILRGLIK